MDVIYCYICTRMVNETTFHYLGINNEEIKTVRMSNILVKLTYVLFLFCFCVGSILRNRRLQKHLK